VSAAETVREEFLSASSLLALLRHRSPKARAWAAERLARIGGSQEIAEALGLAAREQHPDVLSELADWFIARAGGAHAEALVELGTRLALKGREPGVRLLLGLLGPVREEKHLERLLGALLGEAAVPELLALRRAGDIGDFLSRLKALREARPDRDLRRALVHMLPAGPERGIRWAFGLGLLCGEGASDRWHALAAFFLGTPEDESAAGTPRAHDWETSASALEALAERLRSATWLCPALATPSLGAALARLRTAARSVAEGLAELAEGVRWAAAGLSEIPEGERLATILQAARETAESLEAARARLRTAAAAPEAARDLSALPLPDFDGLAADLGALDARERRRWFEAFARILEDAQTPWPPFAEARALTCLAAAGGREAAPLLAARLGGESAFSVQDAAVEALASLGPGVLDYLEPRLAGEDASVLDALLGVFVRFPGERAGRALAAAAPGLFARLPQQDVVRALAATGC